MSNGFAQSDGNHPTEKDRTEIELERLVFGDNSGFHEGLKSHKDGSADFQGLSDREQQQFRGGLEKGKWENLEDADVCKFEPIVRLAFAQYSSSYSSSTPLPRLRRSRTFYPKRPQTRTHRPQTMVTLRHGLIATTNALSSP